MDGIYVTALMVLLI